MFCTDDLHSGDIHKNGHVNSLVKRAVAAGYDLFDVLRAASYNSIKHYSLDLGLWQTGGKADFFVVDNLEQFHVEQVFRKGRCIFERGKACFDVNNKILLDNFSRSPITIDALKVKHKGGLLRIIAAPSDCRMMSNQPAEAAEKYMELKSFIAGVGASFQSPLMTPGFMPLLVISGIKLSDKGLFDGKSFKLIDLFE